MICGNRLSYSPFTQRGLTLLELLLVVTILSAVAWMSLGYVNNSTDQVRFEDTRNRLQAIRLAIIGDTSRTLNGQPVISGYVADMGTPPSHLQALLQEDYCEGYPAINAGADCATAGGTWIDQPTSAFNTTYNLWSGWRGPYLNATELTGYSRFQDGWGNPDNSATNNFGWNYGIDANGDISLQSYGKDGVAGTDDEYPGNASLPNFVDEEYRLLLTNSGGSGGVYVDFGDVEQCWGCSSAIGTDRRTCVVGGGTWEVFSASDETTCTEASGVWLPSSPQSENICFEAAVKTDGNVATIASSPSVFTWNGTRLNVLFQFAASTSLPVGQAAYRIVEYDGTACTTIPFPPLMTNWEHFTVLPRTTLPSLSWDVR